jgi:hypothetical protein
MELGRSGRTMMMRSPVELRRYGVFANGPIETALTLCLVPGITIPRRQ